MNLVLQKVEKISKDNKKYYVYDLLACDYEKKNGDKVTLAFSLPYDWLFKEIKGEKALNAKMLEKVFNQQKEKAYKK